MHDFDSIVIGAGPSGISAAITMARAGMKVAVLERGPYPGSKNLMGGVLFTNVLDTLIPDFIARGAPVERHVSKKTLSILSRDAETAISFRTRNWDAPPHNHSFTVHRARFDRWFAKEAEALGVELYCGVVADELLKDGDGRVRGVRTRMPEGQNPSEGDLTAPVVILAEGANSLLAEKEGMKEPLKGHDVAACVKEVLKLPVSVIEDRFGLDGDQGAAMEFIGEATSGVPGAGFIYTNRDTVSIGLILFLEELSAEGISPVDALDRFKAHPAVAPLIRGGELMEYGAHLLPETGFNKLPLLAKDGLLLVGDAAGLISTSPRHEGSNFAMASGMLAGEAAAEAFKAGDFTAASLSSYKRKLEESFIMKDLEHYR
ncbi:FAD-binding protein, partial [bacterium]